jgi:hypothetical protein
MLCFMLFHTLRHKEAEQIPLNMCWNAVHFSINKMQCNYKTYGDLCAKNTVHGVSLLNLLTFSITRIIKTYSYERLLM